MQLQEILDVLAARTAAAVTAAVPAPPAGDFAALLARNQAPQEPDAEAPEETLESALPGLSLLSQPPAPEPLPAPPEAAPADLPAPALQGAEHTAPGSGVALPQPAPAEPLRAQAEAERGSAPAASSPSEDLEARPGRGAPRQEASRSSAEAPASPGQPALDRLSPAPPPSAERAAAPPQGDARARAAAKVEVASAAPDPPARRARPLAAGPSSPSAPEVPGQGAVAAASDTAQRDTQDAGTGSQGGRPLALEPLAAPRRPSAEAEPREPVAPARELHVADPSAVRRAASELQRASHSGHSGDGEAGRGLDPVSLPPSGTPEAAAAAAPFPGHEPSPASPLPPSPSVLPLAGVGLPAPPHGLDAASLPVAGAPQEAIPVHVEWLAARGGGKVRLRLHPPHLGELQLAVTVRGHNVDVVIHAAHPAAQHAAFSSQEMLADALSGRELRMDQFEVRTGEGGEAGSSAQFGDGGHAEGRDFREGRATDRPLAGTPGGGALRAASAPAAGLRLATADGVDLHI